MYSCHLYSNITSVFSFLVEYALNIRCIKLEETCKASFSLSFLILIFLKCDLHEISIKLKDIKEHHFQYLFLISFNPLLIEISFLKRISIGLKFVEQLFHFLFWVSFREEWLLKKHWIKLKENCKASFTLYIPSFIFWRNDVTQMSFLKKMKQSMIFIFFSRFNFLRISFELALVWIEEKIKSITSTIFLLLHYLLSEF